MSQRGDSKKISKNILKSSRTQSENGLKPKMNLITWVGNVNGELKLMVFNADKSSVERITTSWL